MGRGRGACTALSVKRVRGRRRGYHSGSTAVFSVLFVFCLVVLVFSMGSVHAMMGSVHALFQVLVLCVLELVWVLSSD